MKLSMASSFVLALVAAMRVVDVVATVQLEGSGTPIDKVVKLLGRLRENLQEEGAREAASYDKYACFCKEQANNKLVHIEQSSTTIEELDASVKALGSEITSLDTDVVKLKETIKKEKEESEKATEARNKEFETYSEKQASLAEGIDVIKRAIRELETSRKEVKEASALLVKTKQKLAALPQVDKILALATQEPVAYKFSSGDVIVVLKKVLGTFKEQLAELNEAEVLAKHDYDMLEGARSNKVKSYQTEIDEKEKLGAAKTEEKSEKEGLLKEETEAKNSDQAFLDDLTASCEAKAAAWDDRSKMRASELTAMTEAMEILKGMGDMYNVNKKLTGLVSSGKKLVGRPQKGAATLAKGRNVKVHSFLQLQAAKPLTAFLLEKAKQLQSPMLAALAQKGVSAGDHFEKVRSIIKDLITTLSEAAAAEADAKKNCDGNVADAVEKRDKYQAQMETSAASIDSLKADIETLKTDIASLAGEVAELHKALNELTELREGEKVENQRTVADADAGAEAVKQAIKVLQDHYAKQGEAMVQLSYKPPKSDREGSTVKDLAPETFEGDYKGKATESKGVIGLLEVIQSDFERTSSSTADKEKLAEGDFQKQSGELKGSIEEKEKAKTTKEGDVETKTAELTGLEDDLRSQSTLHEGATEELQKLKSACVDSEESYEERRRRREQEIDALKQALQILEDWKNF
mmetsp:Transcript_7072/g.13132  ORF Transcript_7072/g.13132 Transcript_7072/m.13132 type:complete len:694 (+) Transcript_7072:40-2121(+)